MIARSLIILAGCAFALPAMPEGGDPQSARAFITEQAAIFSARPTEQVAVARRRPVRGSYGPDPTIVALVDRAADRAGVPREIARFHVARESGFRPDARNPRSTATGLLQVIHGSHEAIVGRRMSRAEHFALMRQPDYAMRVGLAHVRACMDRLPGASAHRLWTGCHIKGHAAVGGRIEMARLHFQPDAAGWLNRGSVAMPWAERS